MESEAFRAEADELYAFLGSLGEQEWLRPTAFKDWTAWDVVAHLHWMGRCGRAGKMVLFYGGRERELIDVVREAERQQETMTLQGADVVVDDDLSRALELWGANGFRKTIVSLDGDVVDAHGAVSGGSDESPEREILRKKRLIKEMLERNYILGRCMLLEKEDRRIPPRP